MRQQDIQPEERTNEVFAVSMTAYLSSVYGVVFDGSRPGEGLLKGLGELVAYRAENFHGFNGPSYACSASP